MLAALFAAALILQSPQAAPAAAADVAAAEAAEREAELDRVVCRREHVVGSNRPQRVCRTQREWQGLRDESRQQMNRATRSQPQALPVSPM